MKVMFDENGWEDYCSWVGERAMLKRINRLIDEIGRDPFAGIGKPEPLQHALSGYWSRRITQEDRLVYRVEDNTVIIIQARRHY